MTIDLNVPTRPDVQPGDHLVVLRGIAPTSGERIRVVSDAHQPVWWDAWVKDWCIWCEVTEPWHSQRVQWKRVLRVELAAGRAVQGVLL